MTIKQTIGLLSLVFPFILSFFLVVKNEAPNYRDVGIAYIVANFVVANVGKKE